MNKEYFVQQDAFLEDYKSASKKSTINIDELADQVLSQLNETQEEYYTMQAKDSKDKLPSFSYDYKRLKKVKR